jgi:hypothetical protein
VEAHLKTFCNKKAPTKLRLLVLEAGVQGIQFAKNTNPFTSTKNHPIHLVKSTVIEVVSSIVVIEMDLTRLKGIEKMFAKCLPNVNLAYI